MAGTKISIQVQSSGSVIGDHAIMLSEKLVKQLKIHSNITLRFGTLKTPVTVIPVQNLDCLRMNETLAHKLGLHHNTQLGFMYKTATRTLSIGPLIGVLLTRAHPAQSDRLFGSVTTFCRELVEASQSFGAFVYFFTASNIDPGSGQLEGWTYSGRWRKSHFPVPDVIYNRLTSRKAENRPSVQHFMREVKAQHGTLIFNEKYLNKSEVFDALRHNTALTKYLPESHSFKNFLMLKSMSAKYSVVYLKPVAGSLGKGIIRVIRSGGGSYMCHLTSMTGTTKQSFSSLAALFSTISGKLKQRHYQIQQGLQLIEIDGRPVDFRALVQRGGTGEWAVTSIVARIAGNNHFVSNLARGGTLSKVREALEKSNLGSGMRKTVSSQLRKAAVELAGGIADSIKGHFGELGLDLAVDTNGRVWLLEANSKPSKNDGTPLIEGSVRPSVKAPIHYARFLTGF